jgi:biotin carboxyl carrier protein
MKRYQILFKGHTFDVRLLSDPLQEQVQVEVDGQAFTVQVTTPLDREETVAVVPDTVIPTAPKANAVTAPLPGVIKSVAVRPDQQVAAGDQLLVIEAMKMDNVIRAPRGGTLGTVYIAEGRQVAHGELLLDYRE